MATTKAADLGWQGDSPTTIKERIFRERGEQRYTLELLPIGITLEVDRLRRERDGLMGELTVRIRKEGLPHAKTYDGILSAGDLNFSAVRSRSERAGLLGRRSGADSLDWLGFVEELCIRTIDAERRGNPAVILADVDPADEKIDVWDVNGFPVLTELPMVLFGDSGSGKSYFATYLAGMLAQLDVNVLYADWEFSEREHRKRLAKLFPLMPRNIWYARCDTGISSQIDRLIRLVREHRIQYLFADSMSFAVDGPIESAGSAMMFFRALRQTGIGTMSIAHIPKQSDEGREAQILGSTLYKAGGRSIWFVDKATLNPPGEIRFGLHHRKSNVGEHHKPLGYRLAFQANRTTMEAIDIKSIDELSTQLPLIDRVKMALQQGALTFKQLTDDLSVPAASLRSVLSRHKSTFVKMGNKYGLMVQGVDF